MIKWWCECCKHEWYSEEEPTKCPKCKSNELHKILACEECGIEEIEEDFPYKQLFDGMCKECFKESIENVAIGRYLNYYIESEKKRGETRYWQRVNERNAKKEIVSYIFEIKDDSIENEFAFEILFSKVSVWLLLGTNTEKEEKVVEEARNWAFDDFTAFYDWWCEYE